jgi:hypothetical protein
MRNILDWNTSQLHNFPISFFPPLILVLGWVFYHCAAGVQYLGTIFRTRVVDPKAILTKGRAPANWESCFISVLFVEEQKFENFSGRRGR